MIITLGGGDFSFMVSFPAGSNNGDRACVDINIIDDVAFEKDENILIALKSEENVIIQNPYATIEVEDNDGMCQCV